VSAGRPRIGVTSSHPPAPRASAHPDTHPYLDALERAGAEGELLANDLASVAKRLEAFDGVLFSGGRDVAPALYGEARHPATEVPSNAARDAFEVALIRLTRERGIPTFGICRGLQLANVAFGGTLVQDLPSEPKLEPRIDHRPVGKGGIEREDYAPGHTVHLVAGSALSRLLGREGEFPTNSIHHQAVRAVAPGLRVSARTSDGTIEALDPTFEHPFFFMVQWHPEAMPSDPVSRRLFSEFVAAAGLARPK
jgi:putative glutamine amidotransferase